MGRRRRLEEVKRKRRRRTRKPNFLMAKDLDAIAQRRALMILSVLSGEKSVDEAALEVQMAPANYYQLETKALKAMLVALTPGLGSSTGEPTTLLKQLEAKVLTLEKEKRRLERLLALTRQVVKPGPMSTGQAGRVRLRSTDAGSTPLPSSRRSTKSKPAASSPTESSTPTPAGAGAPSDGTGSWPHKTP